MSAEYFFLYLVYGFVFIRMGIFASQKKDDEVSNIPLVKSLKFLGLFGITHGLSEWITMVVIADLYSDFFVYFFIIKQVLKAVSFAFLLAFGISLLPKHFNKSINLVPVVLFFIWCTGFGSLLYLHGLDYHLVKPQYNVIVLRYLMGMPGGLITALALGLNVKHFKDRNQDGTAKKYKHLAFIFLVYGLVDGLIVREMDFFPANILNNQLFLQSFGFPIQLLKIMIGVAINILLIRVVETFGWEQKEKVRQLNQRIIADQERRKLGLEIHDSIIQSIYAANLKLQCFMQNYREETDNELLLQIRCDLGETLKKTRDFISTTSLQTVELQDLSNEIVKLAEVFNNHHHIKIAVDSPILPSSITGLSDYHSSQIYYIVQEAISNVIKHSKGTQAKVLIKLEESILSIRIIDDGVGIQLQMLDQQKQFGFVSMKERAETVKGTLKVRNLKQGTEVELLVPLEGYNYA